MPKHYDLPWGPGVAGTVFDPTSDTFGPIMASIQAGEFEHAIELLTSLASGEDRTGEIDYKITFADGGEIIVPVATSDINEGLGKAYGIGLEARYDGRPREIASIHFWMRRR